MYEDNYTWNERAELFKKVMALKDGWSFTFTPDNVAPGDHFLIFSAYKSIKVTFHKNRVPFWFDFDGDEHMLLENVPTSFLDSIVRNIK